MAVPVELEIFMRDNTKAGTQSVGKNVTDIEKQTQLLIKALEEVRAQQQQLLNMSKASGESHTKEAATIQALTGEINKLKKQLEELKVAKKQAAETPNPRVDVDTDAVMRKTNNLKMSFSQVARELPSLAMGPQMFFLAISNNLPMLTDAIADVRKQNDMLIASGKKAVPVWKQLSGALFSWQTGLVTAITLIVVFYKDFANWMKTISNGKKELSDVQKMQEALSKSQLEGSKAALDESNKLRILYNATQDTSKSLNERNKAVDELQKKYPSYFGQLSNEEVLAGKASDAYDRLTQSIISSARARAAMDRMVEEQSKVLDNEQKINDAYVRLTEAQNNYNTKKAIYDKGLEEGFGSATAKIDARYDVTMADVAVKKIEKEIAGYRKSIYESNKLVKELEKNIQAEDIITETGTGSTTTKQDYATQLAEARLKAQQTVEKLRIQIMMDSREKRRAIAEQEYKETIADIDRTEKATIAALDNSKKQGDVVTDADYKAVRDNATTQRALQQLALNKELEAIDREYYDKAAEAMIAYNKEYGTYQEKRAAIAAEYAKKILKAETEGERLSLQKQYKKDINDLNFEEMKSGIDFAKVFGNIDIQSTESLKALQDKLYEYINGAAKNLSPENLKELQDAFKEIDAELLERNPFEGLKQRTEAMQNAAQELAKAKDELERVQAGEKVVDTYKSVTDAQGNTKIEKTYLTAEKALKNYNKAKEKSEETSRDMNKAEKMAKEQVDELVTSIKGIGSTIGGEAGEIINLIGDITSFTTSAIDGISAVMQTGANAMSAVEKASVILGILSTAAQVFQSIGDMFGGDSGPSDYEVMVEKYQALSSLWDDLISKKMEYISIDYGSEASKAAEEARKLTETQIALVRQTMEEAAYDKSNYRNILAGAAGLNIKIGLYNKRNDIGIGSLEDLLAASPEKMQELLQDTRFAEKIASNNKELLQYMQTLAGYSDQLDEIDEKENSAVVGVSFSDFKNSYADLLTDLDATNEDFANNFEQHLQEALLRSLMANEYNTEIQKLYDEWVKLGKDGLTEIEIGQLKQMEQQLSQQMINDRDALKDTFGWDTTEGVNQSPQSGALTTMSQDSIATFEGIGRSMQTHLISIDKVSVEIREQQKEDSKALVKIVENTSHILPIRELLEKIDREGITVR